jgi:site-specific recombinase XerC
MHALRHFYAPVLIDAGESVKAVAEYLGHSDPGFTLRVYAHLLPASEDRARNVIEAAFMPRAAANGPSRPPFESTGVVYEKVRPFPPGR